MWIWKCHLQIGGHIFLGFSALIAKQNTRTNITEEAADGNFTSKHPWFNVISWKHLTLNGLLPLWNQQRVGSLWLENDLHENELEFESYMGRSKKNVRVTSDGIHAEIHEIWTCVAPAAPPLFHAAVNPCLQGESPWNWSCNSVNLRKSTVTWMRRHYDFTVISRWSTFSSTVNVCNINCVIFSDTHCSFGPPILWHSPFHAGVSVY